MTIITKEKVKEKKVKNKKKMNLKKWKVKIKINQNKPNKKLTQCHHRKWINILWKLF